MSEWPLGSGEMGARIRAHDWAATPLGPVSGWSSRLKLMVEQVLASPLVASLTCGPERVLIYNDAAAELYGDRHPAALGRPLPETFPAGWATVAPLYERAFAGEAVPVAGQPLDTRGEGEATEVFDALLMPVREESGRVAYVHMAGAVVGDPRRAEMELRESEAKYRRLFTTMGQGFSECEIVRDRDGRAVDYRLDRLNPAFERLTGIAVADAVGRTAREMLTGLEDHWIALTDRVVRSGEPEHVEYELATLGRWYATHVYPAGGDRFIALYEDISDRKRAEHALRESEERQAFLLRLSDALRHLGDPVEVQEVASRMVGEHLEADRVAYSEVEGDELVVHRDYAAGAPSMVGRYPKASFGRKIEGALGTSGMVWANDVQSSPELSDAERAAFRSAGIASYVGSTLYKDGRFAGAFGLHQTTPRVWTEDEIALVDDVAERIWAAVTRARMEAALRESEERQAFLLKLSDALRPLADPAEIQATAMRVLGQHLGVTRSQYYEADATGEFLDSFGGFTDGLPPVVERVRMDDFGPYVGENFRAGRTLAVADVSTDPRVSERELQAYDALGFRAFVGIPLVKNGRLVGTLGLHHATARDWSTNDLAVATETAERTWAALERARAEDALRVSEDRFQQFAKASAAGLWIRDADTLAMEFASPAIAAIYGVEADALLGDVTRWAATIVPEDRDTALRHLEQARAGEAVVHEFRIQRPADGAFRWIRDTDFPLRDDGHIPRIGGIAEDVTEAKLAAEHSAVLLAELQHRVRNIMALLRSITARTAERAESVPDYETLMMGRLLAFARVQALLTRTANVSVGIAGIVHDEVGVQAQHAGQYVLDGPDIALSPKAAEVLTLAIHELAINAAKYGALAAPEGKVTVRWSTSERRGVPWLAFDWAEEGAPERIQPLPGAPRRRGFGSELIEGRIPYELRGRGQVTIEPGGARCHLEFPLQGGASILETGAPQRATVFGGAIDMTGEPDLTGRRVLVVEDDYYLASDAARALRGAGAEVMGPCATEEDARAELDERRPDVVVVDINLGPGPSFKLAETLKDQGIPFVFTTGYDAAVIPAEFEGVERLQKPLQLRQIVGAVAKLAKAA